VAVSGNHPPVGGLPLQRLAERLFFHTFSRHGPKDVAADTAWDGLSQQCEYIFNCEEEG
jgi:hypothetical protein